MRKDQLELVTSAGPYLRGELALSPRLLASAGVRADAVRFEVRDNLINATNPDDSGERTLHAVSPSLGVVWRATPLSAVYASLSSSFETPTTTELGNKPDGSAGINPELQPQRTVAMELGSKGILSIAPVRWDVALFEAHAHDELVPFDIPGGAGRRYYRNAGRTVRRGGELGVEAGAGALGVRLAYSYSHFRYQEYIVGTTSYAGNRIPGVPEHALATTVAWRHDDLTLSTTADIASAVDVDDANSTQARGPHAARRRRRHHVAPGWRAAAAARRNAECHRRADGGVRKRQRHGRKVFRAGAGTHRYWCGSGYPEM